MFSRNSVRLPEALHARAKAAAAKAGYSSLDEFVVHALEKALAELEMPVLDEEVVKQLRGLGYLK